MFYSHFLPKAVHIFLFPPLLATCPHHVSVTLTGVSLQADNIRLIFAVARGFDHITFIVSCAVYRLFCSSIIHSHRVMKLGRLDLTRQSLTHHCARLSTQFMLQCVHLTSHVSRCVFFLEKASETYTQCGRVCSLWQNPLRECTLLQGVSL